MDERSLKQFITAFLVLALVAGSLSLALSNIVNRRDRVAVPVTAGSPDTEQGRVPKIGDQALVESLPDATTASTYSLATPFTPSTEPQDNFTDNLANKLAYDFVVANPDGPQDTTGAVVPRNIDKVIDSYIQEAALSPVLYAVDTSRIKVADTYTTPELTAYFNTVQDILRSSGGDRGVGRIIAAHTAKTADSATILSSSELVASEALNRLYALTVPEPALALHKSMLQFYSLHKTVAGLDYADDPLKAQVYAEQYPQLAERESARLTLAVQRFTNELPDILARNPVERPLAARILGISIAHAVPVEVTADGSVPAVSSAASNAQSAKSGWARLLEVIGINVSTAGSLAQLIKQELKSIALQILKNQLVHRIVQDVIKWVQGGGKPKFITDWKGFFRDVASRAAGSAIQQIAPRLCTGIQPLVLDALNRDGTARGREYDRFNCTLSQVVQNLKLFYADFAAGGWVAYAELLAPQNNIWGSVLITYQQLYGEASAAAAAQQQQAQANKGFLPENTCIDYGYQRITVEVDFEVYNAGDLTQAAALATQAAKAQFGDDYGGNVRNCRRDAPVNSGLGTLYSVSCEVAVCRPGAQRVGTPGNVVAGQLDKALGSGLDNIISANDLAALTSALIDSAINRLVNFSTRGILGLFGGGGSGTGGDGGPSGIGGGTGDTVSTSTIDSQRSSLRNIVGGLQQQLTTASSSANELTAAIPALQTSLTNVQNACVALSTDAQQRLAALATMQTRIADDVLTLNNIQIQINEISTRITDAQTIDELSGIFTDLESLTTSVGPISSRLATRSSRIQQLTADASTNLTNNRCDVPLTSLDE